jgi:uncharacterized protein YndB with AHSA1/START domain
MRRFLPAVLFAGAAASVAGTVAAAGPGYDLVVKRVLEAPVERVWSAWSEGESIRQWWGPEGFTAPVANMDFREGGRSIVCMQPKGGPLMCNSWTYRKIVPGEEIAFDAGWTDAAGNQIDPRLMGLPDDIPEVVPHVIAFRALPDDRTELTVSEFGYGSPETVALSKAGLDQVLDKLAASLRQPSQPR